MSTRTVAHRWPLDNFVGWRVRPTTPQASELLVGVFG
jgi:hypothetical protein